MNKRAALELGLAVTTVGRPTLTRLLDSVAASSLVPPVVVVANQSGRPLPLPTAGLPFDLRIVESSGGASKGRNDAMAALGDEVDLIGFPNDDTSYAPLALERVVAAFAGDPEADAVACSLVEGATIRFVLPDCDHLDRVTIWRAIEAATFIRRPMLMTVGGFRQDLGTGCPSPWQSGEGTDLLLRVLECGGVVASRPDITVTGTSERRDLDAAALVAKHRRYARGTGYVYRIHTYPTWIRWRIVLSPWLRLRQHDPSPVLSVRLAVARSVGRIEGLLGRVLPTPRRRSRHSAT